MLIDEPINKGLGDRVTLSPPVRTNLAHDCHDDMTCGNSIFVDNVVSKVFGDLTFDILWKLATETSMRSMWITLTKDNFSTLQLGAPSL